MADFNLDEMLKKITDNPEIMSKISQIAKGDSGENITDKLPDVIATISPLINQGQSENKNAPLEGKADTPVGKIDEKLQNANSQATLPIAKISEKISKNSKLLLALKPYLSKERGDVVDSIIKMAQVADLMKLMR